MDEDGACEDCAMQRQHWYDMKRFLVFVASDDFRDNLLFGMVYASACLPDKTQPLRLQLEGRKKQWPAMLTVTCRNQRRVYDGWKEFARDNKLKPGDICLFEVSSRNSRSLTMTVHLVR
ncbi:hypothetical protein ACQ4PT_012258 [Festuca glaucescens]